MKKIAAVAGPIVVMIMLVPFLAALMVTAIASPAVGQELKAIACAGPLPASGSWRPPFQQRYSLTSGYGMRFHPTDHQWKLHTGQDLAVASELERLLGLGPIAQDLVTGWGMQGKGRALWCVGEQMYKVQTVLHPLELDLTFTNDAIESAA